VSNRKSHFEGVIPNPAQFNWVRDLQNSLPVRSGDPSLRLKNGYGQDDISG
jgi:hypothetical protein